MKTRRRRPLFSMSSFYRDYGLDRVWVNGFVHGAGIRTYRGDRNALAVDSQGREQIVREACRLGMIDDPASN